MQTLAMIAQKGGTGKTTLALSLAVAAEAAGRAVLVVDLDPQASACKWSDRRSGETPSVIDAQPARLAAALAKAHQAGIDLAIVDTPARVEQAAAEAAKIADLVLIPCKPSILDLETLRATVELVQGRSRKAPLVILNAVPAQGTRHQQAAEAIISMGFEVCPAHVGQRVAFEYAAQAGQTVTEYEPEGRAASEIRQLYEFDLPTCRHVDKGIGSMSKRPNLAAIAAAAGSTRRAPDLAVVPAAPPAAETASRSTPRTRVGTKQIAAHFPEDVAWQLRALAVDRKTTVQKSHGGSVERPVRQIRQAGGGTDRQPALNFSPASSSRHVDTSTDTGVGVPTCHSQPGVGLRSATRLHRSAVADRRSRRS